MIVYHEARPDDIADILEHGLKCTSSGAKSDDRLIRRTNDLLDSYRPQACLANHISRNDNIYAYLFQDGLITDIADGKRLTLKTFRQRKRLSLLALRIDESRAYVSDLDRYDTVKQAVADKSADIHMLNRLVEEYWSALQPLSGYDGRSIARPEVMITYDITPNYIIYQN